MEIRIIYLFLSIISLFLSRDRDVVVCVYVMDYSVKCNITNLINLHSNAAGVGAGTFAPSRPTDAGVGPNTKSPRLKFGGIVSRIPGVGANAIGGCVTTDGATGATGANVGGVVGGNVGNNVGGNVGATGATGANVGGSVGANVGGVVGGVVGVPVVGTNVGPAVAIIIQ